MFALVKCGQVRCHLLVWPCQILPKNSCQQHKFAIIHLSVKDLYRAVFQNQNSSSPGQSCFTDLSLCIDSSDLWSHYFISFLSRNWQSTVSSILSLKVSGILSFLHGLKKRRYGSQQLPIYNHWPSDFQAMLPPSCHLCCTSPLQVSKNGLSFPGSDARHFPDTLKRKSYPKPLRFKIYHLCLIEPPSPNTHAWLPPNPWHRTFAGKIKDVLFTEFLPPILLGLFHWQHQDNCHRSWSEKDESDDKKSMSIIILACCLFVMAKTWFPPKPWQ